MGNFKVVAAILIWSSLGIIVRWAGIPVIEIIFYSSLIAIIPQSLILLGYGKFKGLRLMDSNNRYLLISIGICYIVNSFLYYYSLTHTSIANAVLTHYTAPVFVAVFAPVFLSEKTSIAVLYSIVIASIGLYLMFGTVSLSDREIPGVWAGLASGVVYAMIILIMRTLAQKYDSLLIVFLQNVVVITVLLPVIINFRMPWDAIPFLLVLGIVHSTIAPFLYLEGLKTVRANEAAVLGYFEPLGAITLGAVFFSEVPSLKALFGGLMIIASGYLILRDSRDSKSKGS